MRVKRGVAARAKHRKIIKQARGMDKAKRTSSRMARQAVYKSLQYAYRDRRNRKRDFHRLWITRINAGVRSHGLTYSKFVNLLKGSGVELDRKVLAELAAREPVVFGQIVQNVTKTTTKP